MLLCYIFDNKSHGKANLDFRGIEEIPLDGADPPLHLFARRVYVTLEFIFSMTS
jgi:hypothetical protein